MRRLLRILLKTVAIGFAILLVALVALYLLRGPLLARPLARIAGEQLSSALGGEFVLERVEGSWFGGLELVALRTKRAPPEGPLVHVEFERASVTYSLFGLLGDRPQDAIRSVELSGARVEVDLKRLSADEELEEAAEPVRLHELVALLPARLPHLDVRGEVAVGFEFGDLRLQGLHLARAADDELHLRADRVLLPELVAPEHEGVLDVVVGRSPERTLYLRQASPLAGIRIEEAVLTSFSEWRASIGLEAGSLHAQGGEGSIGLRSDAIAVERLPQWVRRQTPPDFEWPRSGRVAVDAELSLEADGPAGRASLEVHDLAWHKAMGEHLAVQARFAGDRIDIDSLTARLATGSVKADAVTLELSRPYLLASLGSVDVDVPDLAAITEKLPLGKETARRIAELPRPLALTAKASAPEGRRILFERLAISGADTNATLTGSARLPEDPSDWLDTILDLELVGQIGNLNRWSPGLPTIEGAIAFRGAIGGRLEQPNAALKVSGGGLLVEGRKVERVEVDAALLWPALDVKTFLLEAEPGTIEAKGATNLEALTVGEGRYTIDVVDLEELLAMVPGAPALSGTLHGEGRLRWDAEGLHGNLVLGGRGLAYGDEELGTLKLSAAADGMRLTSIEAQIDGPLAELDLRGSADLERRELLIATLEAQARGYRAKLEMPVRVIRRDRGFEVPELELSAFGGTIVGNLSVAGEGVHGALAIRHIDLAPFLKEGGLGGRADLDITLMGESFVIEASIPDLAYDDHSGHLKLKAAQDDRGLTLERLSLVAGDLVSIAGTGTLPYRLDLQDGPVWVEEEGHAPRFELTGSSARLPYLASGFESGSVRFRLHGVREGLELDADLTDAVFQGGIQLPSRTDLELRGGEKGLEMKVSCEPDGIGEVAGTVRSRYPVDWLRPKTLREALKEGEIDGKVSIDFRDLSFVAGLSKQIRHLVGSAHVDVEIKGPIRAPAVIGEARFEEVDCTLGGLPPIQEAHGRLVFTPHRIELAPFEGQLGYSPLRVEGTIDLPPGGVPVLAIHTKGDNVLLARERHLRVRADLDLAVDGPLDALTLQGDVEITDALYSEPIDILAGGGARTADTAMQLFSIRSGPLSKAKLDVRIKGNQSFRIRNNFVRGAFSLALHLKGNGLVPEPQGSVFFQEMLVGLPATNLKIDQGEVSFPRDNPFAAKVEINAHTRMRGFDLGVRVTGVSPDLRVLVSSSPALSQEAAITLLSTGNLPEDYETEAGQRAAMMRAGTFLGKQFVSRAMGPSDPDEETIFDRIEVEGGREISDSGQETLEVEFRIRRPWYFRAERDRYDQYNAGIVWRIRFR